MSDRIFTTHEEIDEYFMSKSVELSGKSSIMKLAE